MQYVLEYPHVKISVLHYNWLDMLLDGLKSPVIAKNWLNFGPNTKLLECNRYLAYDNCTTCAG